MMIVEIGASGRRSERLADLPRARRDTGPAKKPPPPAERRFLMLGGPANAPDGRLRDADVVDGDLAGTAVLGGVEGDLLALDETAQAGALERGGVDEDVLAAVVRLDKAEALLIVVEFHGARIHRGVLCS